MRPTRPSLRRPDPSSVSYSAINTGVPAVRDHNAPTLTASAVSCFCGSPAKFSGYFIMRRPSIVTSQPIPRSRRSAV